MVGIKNQVCRDSFRIVMIVMHVLCYFVLSLQLVQTILITRFCLGAGRNNTGKEIVARLSYFY